MWAPTVNGRGPHGTSVFEKDDYLVTAFFSSEPAEMRTP